MPEKSKDYRYVIFTPEVIRAAAEAMMEKLQNKKPTYAVYKILFPDEEWTYDTEDEFFAGYRKGFWGVSYQKSFSHRGIYIHATDVETSVSVKMPTRSEVEKVFNIFEENVIKCQIPKPPKERQKRPIIKVFIGHGHDPQWRDLKDHLHDKQGIAVEHYEHGARAGLTILEVLNEMLTSSSFAVLVLTGEDEDAEGKLHARENVIHELGLFQGRLGLRKAIILLEEDVEEFSNIRGINQIRFSKRNIQETYGEVLAAIRREYSGKE